MLDVLRTASHTLTFWLYSRWRLCAALCIAVIDLIWITLSGDSAANYVSLAIWFLAGLLAAWDLLEIRSQFRSYFTEKIPIDYSRISLVGPYKNWQLILNTNESPPTAAIFSLPLNQSLRVARITLEIRTLQFRLPEKLHKFAYYCVRHLKAGVRFNGAKVRLATDLLHGSTTVSLQRTNYFMSICTNELATREIRARDRHFGARHEGTLEMDGRALWLLGSADRPILAPLSDSQCSNHIGISTLAITQDGRIPIVKQGKLTAESQGLNAPSGSGSMDWSDIAHAEQADLASLITEAASRELCEECNIERSEVIATHLVGYARLLHRGGKPEFFCLSILSNRPEFDTVRHNERIYVRALKEQHLGFGAPDVDLKLAFDELSRLYSSDNPNNSILLNLNIRFIREWLDSARAD